MPRGAADALVRRESGTDLKGRPRILVYSLALIFFLSENGICMKRQDFQFRGSPARCPV
jgi:hypothetical protein